MMSSEFTESQIESEGFDDFFSKSILRSGYFIAGSVICVGALAYDVVILYRHWDTLSTGDAPIQLLVAGMLIGFLWVSLAGHGRVRKMYRDGSVSDVKKGSAIHTALQVAAETIFNMLFWDSTAALVSLVAIDKLLSVVRVK